MLVTSCKDDICRIWAETVLPDDGLIDSYQVDVLNSQLLSAQQHKKRFLQRLHHIRSHSVAVAALYFVDIIRHNFYTASVVVKMYLVMTKHTTLWHQKN